MATLLYKLSERCNWKVFCLKKDIQHAVLFASASGRGLVTFPAIRARARAEGFSHHHAPGSPSGAIYPVPQLQLPVSEDELL
ncbi:glycosyl hydrolase family 20 [Colletotrichum scovillei]|uniref:Glycosyl hydrolase family 20 n=1 Tax=Colletotrichum scovillei TaxID=1209932 RepID=A0A9P7RFP7_9PEZI|nr:glycosyl hydrolase family 20 [Colletotrichum scovillei]KAG7075324.1 glycosyl hydrolase family 20 [Colletotrichum scovillei]KAG7082569.1 glycosyl hydrolase family 20 [Colletotrichum scovillei]